MDPQQSPPDAPRVDKPSDGVDDQQSLEDLQRAVDVNLISVLDRCQLITELLRAAPAANVINVASMYGIVASRAPMPDYNATKAALINLTRTAYIPETNASAASTAGGAN